MLDEKEIITKISFYSNKLGFWSIKENELVIMPFVLGYYYDEKNNIWKTYKVGERGDVKTYDEKNEKKEILNDFLAMLEFTYRIEKN